MSELTAPKIQKWPFIVGDVALLLTAFYLVSRIEGEFRLLITSSIDRPFYGFPNAT